ncbi:hypothetical protein [Bacillus rhizoplanae]|uniref:hypothetical protein n=1 Tax=Bacillus rhizoplanae TaxID=2880966 RepID=UPI003D194A23
MKQIKCILLYILLLTGCNNESYSIIEWTDFIKWDGDNYKGIDTGIIADQNLIGETFGTVKFQVNDNIHNSNYRIKDGDAAYLEKGTKLYSIKGKKELLAVKDPSKVNGYRIYSLKKEPYTYKWYYKDMPKQDVIKIEIYERTAGSMPHFHRGIQDINEIRTVLSLLEQGKTTTEGYNDTKLDAKEFTIVFYTKEPIAYAFSIFRSDDKYYWAPWEGEVLPKEIKEYVK